jgi:hypothetical protein
MEDTQLFFDNINNSPYLQHDTHSTNSILADDFVLPLAKTPDWRSSSVSSTVSDHSGSDSGYKPSKSKEEVPLKIVSWHSGETLVFEDEILKTDFF